MKGAPRRSVAKWIQCLTPDIVGCGNCQPWDSEEHTYFWVDGEKSCVTDFLWWAGVPETKWDAVMARLRCGACHATLSEDDWVGVRSDTQRLYDQMRSVWHRKLAPKMEDFAKWLERYPYMGLQHPIGRRLWKEMNDFPVLSWQSARTWCRARTPTGPKMLGIPELGPPPSPPASEGRFNHHGQIVWYLANDADTAAAEAIDHDEGIAWVMQFSVGPLERILDLSPSGHPEDLAGLPLFALGLSWTEPHLEPASSTEWKPQYFVPRFIADCARAKRFNGIRYRSTKFFGDCLVLFNWNAQDIVPVGQPRLHTWSRKRATEAMPF